MLKVYAANTLPDAYLIVQMLATEGIAAKVFNENAQGGVGEIPFTHAYPEVWIVHETDLEHAQQVIAGFERGPETLAPVKCTACGEENPGHFALCWHCGQALASEG